MGLIKLYPIIYILRVDEWLNCCLKTQSRHLCSDWPLSSVAPHLVAHVDFCEAEGAEVRVGSLHRRFDGLSEQLVHKLADERPHLLHGLDRIWGGGGGQWW